MLGMSLLLGAVAKAHSTLTSSVCFSDQFTTHLCADMFLVHDFLTGHMFVL